MIEGGPQGLYSEERRFRWDATPADVSVGETPKLSRWGRTPVSANADVPMTSITMNTLGFMLAGRGGG
jgi:splicing factor 3B subunit 1